MSLTLSLPITSFVAVLLSLLMVGMAIRIGMMRRANKIGAGDGKNKGLAKLIAAHSNAVDNIPLGIILLALAEIQGANASLLATCGIIFVSARGMSAFGLKQHAGHSPGRFYGIILTWLSLVSLAVINLFLQLG